MSDIFSTENIFVVGLAMLFSHISKYKPQEDLFMSWVSGNWKLFNVKLVEELIKAFLFEKLV